MSIKIKSKLTNISKVGCLFYGLLILFSFYCYIINAIKLCYCDFDAPYKTEVIHAVRVIFPPTSVITVWWD